MSAWVDSKSGVAGGGVGFCYRWNDVCRLYHDSRVRTAGTHMLTCSLRTSSIEKPPILGSSVLAPPRLLEEAVAMPAKRQGRRLTQSMHPEKPSSMRTNR